MPTGLGRLPALAGAVVAWTVGAAEAHAAPLLSGDLVGRALERVAGIDALGGCFEALGFGALFHPGHHGAPSGAAACESLHGIGLALLALVALVTIALGRMRLRTETKRLEVAQRLVEQGIDPPPGLLMGPARNDLRKGIVLLFAGAGLFASGLFGADRGLMAGGLVPEFIGVGYLVSYWLTARRPGSAG